MAFKHGVYTREVPTSLIPVVQMEAGLPVVFGTAPVFLKDSSNVNKPVLCYSYDEAVAAFGYSTDWEKYTLCEFIYSQFALYGMAPCVLVNVFDPAKHKEVKSLADYEILDSQINLGQNVIISAGLTFEEGKNFVLDQDYTLEYDSDGNAIMNILSSGNMNGLASCKVGFTIAKPENVNSSDIIGGIDINSGEYKGLELINRIFPKFRIVPGLIAAPGFSEKPAVAAVMRAKADNINGIFTAQAVIDIPCDSANAPTYSRVPEWKNRNNYMAEREIVCWPKIKLGDDVYHLSTQLIGLMNKTDKARGDIPYKSPSNELLQMDSCVNDSGQEIELGLEQANYLNSQGIVTALNWVGGWRAWGNRTGCYPANTDVKDAFIPIRRMFDFVSNQFILTFWQKVDEPLTIRLIRTIISSFDMYLNSLQAMDAILGGRVEFIESENAIINLMDGKLTLHIFMTPPSPAEDIEGIFEYDPEYINELFEAIRG